MAEPAPRAEQVTGQVLDSAGQPVVAAEVIGALDLSDSAPGIDSPDAHPVSTKTGPEGRFQLIWPDRLAARQPASLWVVHPGSSLSRIEVPVGPVDLPIVISLRQAVPSAGASLQVLSPQGKPVAGARVSPTRWVEGNLAANSTQTLTIPPAVVDRVARPTDAEGRVHFDWVPALRLAAVLVVAADLGEQLAGWEETLSARHRQVWLRSVGRVEGQVRTNELAAVAQHQVRVTSRVGTHVVGQATVGLDAAGRFQVAHLAAGAVDVRVPSSPESRELAGQVAPQNLPPAGLIRFEIPFHRGVQVRGSVRERGNGPAVGGVTLELRGRGTSFQTVRTDDQGRFAAFVLPGTLSTRLAVAPPPFLVTDSESNPPALEVRAGDAGIDWPPIELDRGVMIRGRLAVDEARPNVTDRAVVQASWVRRTGRMHQDEVTASLIRADGQFEVGPIPPGVDVDLAARLPGGRLSAATPVTHDRIAVPIELRLPTPGELLAPTGRVVDAAGRPVAGALVQFRAVDSGRWHWGFRPGRRIAVDGFDTVVTDEQGRYTGAPRLERHRSYLAAAEAADCESGRTRPVGPRSTSDSQIEFPDLVLHRRSTRSALVGQVLGQDGRPIAGVTVHDMANHQAITDDLGWFRLDTQGDDGPAFLFAEKEGYRFSGQMLAHPDHESGRPLILPLIRNDEPGSSHLPPDPAEPVGSQLVVDLLIRSMIVNPLVERTMVRHDTVSRSILLEHLARQEPDRVVAWLDAGVIIDRRVADGLRRLASRTLATSHFDAALGALTGIEESAIRFHAVLDVVTEARLTPIELRRATIESVERDARLIEDLSQRALILARVAGQWLDLADPVRAQRCLAEAQGIADLLPRATTGAQVWCALIDPLARLDPAQARAKLPLLIDPVDLDRCRLAIALQSAQRDPIAAVSLFRRIKSTKILVKTTPELCYRLAPIALDQARGLVQTLAQDHPVAAAYALGQMAASLARSDRATATGLLHEAYAQLEAAIHSQSALKHESDLPPAIIAAALLPIVEAVDPTFFRECFWKCLALHPRQLPPTPQFTAILALLLDRYDPAVARHLFDPSRLNYALIAPADLKASLLATAQLAPEVACHWAMTPAEPDVPEHLPWLDSDPSRLLLVTALTSSVADRWNHATRHLLDLWTPPHPAH